MDNLIEYGVGESSGFHVFPLGLDSLFYRRSGWSRPLGPTGFLPDGLARIIQVARRDPPFFPSVPLPSDRRPFGLVSIRGALTIPIHSI
jgi:hypothetical protein